MTENGNKTKTDAHSSSDMSYGDYLHLDSILNAQHCLSHAHDEMLFIIQHQTSELWMRLTLHEINAARVHLAAGDFALAFKMLARVSRIFDQLNLAWDVLRTLTPNEYISFRDDLAKSSGFQSHQYRLIEFTLGNRNTSTMDVHKHRPETIALLKQELAMPSLYHVALDALSKELNMTFDPASITLDAPHQSNESIMEAWKTVYCSPEKHWVLYELAEKLVDLEDYFRRWRFNHVTTVERIIGFKHGTGGTNGVKYLRAMLEVELFPELWHVRGAL
ncbi:MAG: tryptophan 2,3-dioxygenase [Granulosicoccus sp.]